MSACVCVLECVKNVYVYIINNLPNLISKGIPTTTTTTTGKEV